MMSFKKCLKRRWRSLRGAVRSILFDPLIDPNYLEKRKQQYLELTVKSGRYMNF